MPDLNVILLAIILCAAAAQNVSDSGTESENVNIRDENSPAVDVENFSDYVPDDEDREPSDLERSVIVLYSIITCVGLVANSVVLFVIFAGNEMGKTVTAIYVLQLTIADTIFLIMLPIFTVQKAHTEWNYGPFMCALSQTIKYLNYYAGIFFLTAMSVDRFVAVAYGTRLTKVRTKERTYRICAGVWAAAVVMSTPLMAFSGIDRVGTKQKHTKICRVMFPGYVTSAEKGDQFFYAYSASGSGSSEEYYYVDESTEDYQETVYICNMGAQPTSYSVWLTMDFLFAFVIPFLIIIAMYALIITHLKTAEKKIGHTATSKAAKMRKRVTMMVAALVICFTICWLPHHFFMLARMRGFESSYHACHVTEEFFVALAFSNSALNPLLYTFMGNNFRDRFKKSVRNTQQSIRKRTSSRSSMQRKSTNSHSGTHQSKKLAAAVARYRHSSSNGSMKGDSQNGKPNRCQISLLGSKRDRSHSDINSGDGSEKAHNFYGITSTMLENTMETHLEMEMQPMRAPE